jgi:uncharacterized protein YqgC (DUF456 family)
MKALEKIKKYLDQLQNSKSRWKKIIGIICFIIGFLALITPLTPGSWLIFVGLELLGFRLVIWEKIKNKVL